MDEDIVIDETFKTGYNLGYRLGTTEEGRRKAINLTKGKEDLAISQAIIAGCKQALLEQTKQSLNDIYEQQNKNGLRH